MNFNVASILRGVLLLGCGIAAPSYADWATSPLARVTRAAPANAQIQAQNPPSFSWAMHPSNPAAYVLEIRRTDLAGAPLQTFTTDRTWYLPLAALAPGAYSWRVRPSTTTDWSTARPFYVDASASKPFLVPDTAALKARIAQRAHPRGLAEDIAKVKWSAAKQAERNPAVNVLVGQVQWRAKSIPIYKDSDWPLVTSGAMTAAGNVQVSQIRWAMGDVTRQLEAAALLWRVTGDRQYLNEAVTRGGQLAALSPTGPTSLANSDQENRLIALTLAKAFDFLGSDLDSASRASWLKAIEGRTAPIYDSLKVSNGILDQYPFDSHGVVAQGYVALISALTLGDIPAAEKWFDFSFRAYVNSIYIWSGPEGGFANGTSYGQHMALTSLFVWQPLANATGVNLFEKPWSAGFLRMFMYFQPPGSPTHVFGDEHETAPIPTELKGFASRLASPEAAWYVRNLVGEEDALTLAQAPWPLPVASVTTATPPPNAALFSSIGWVAMHSSLALRDRTSVYFKSSPYGSFNHSHADQNSIVLVSGGRPLLTEAGWYDWYGSPLWNDWYRQTKAHNAVTFDGGKGQLAVGFDTLLSRNGKINSFATTPGLDYAEGDATAAFDGALTLNKRQLWYLRGTDVLVVRDTLASATARAFEWNMHAIVPMTVATDGGVVIQNADRNVCISSVTGDTTFVKKTGGASKTGTYEDHAAFVKKPATSAEFLVVLDVGCKKPKISLVPTATGRSLTVGTFSMALPK